MPPRPSLSEMLGVAEPREPQGRAATSEVVACSVVRSDDPGRAERRLGWLRPAPPGLRPRQEGGPGRTRPAHPGAHPPARSR